VRQDLLAQVARQGRHLVSISSNTGSGVDVMDTLVLRQTDLYREPMLWLSLLILYINSVLHVFCILQKYMNT
jgi:hypothetical protein